MSIRKIYEIALRVVGVLFLAQGCRYFVTLAVVTGYSFTQLSQVSTAYSIVWNLSSFVVSFAIGGLLLMQAGQFAARLAPSDEQTSIPLVIQPNDILHIGFLLIGVSLIASGLSGSIGEVLRVATYGATSSMQVQFGRSLLGNNFVADVVRIILGTTLLWHRKLGRHLRTLGVFLQNTRDKQDEDSEPPVA